jgi:hypothetical protein
MPLYTAPKHDEGRADAPFLRRVQEEGSVTVVGGGSADVSSELSVLTAIYSGQRARPMSVNVVKRPPRYRTGATAGRG